LFCRALVGEIALIMKEIQDQLLQLSHELGKEERELAILGEGNTSAKIDDQTFLVKASGSSLKTLGENDVTACHFDSVLQIIDTPDIADDDLNQALMDSRVSSESKKPSLETMFHAWLLKLDGVSFVGHCHPVSCNQILVTHHAKDFAQYRSCPDEVVCCGPKSVFVGYEDPGLPLAIEIARKTEKFIAKNGYTPRLICLKNHGIIGLGSSWASVLATILMADKAAKIFAGAAAVGGSDFLAKSDVDRLAGRADEAYRQKQLKLN